MMNWLLSFCLFWVSLPLLTKLAGAAGVSYAFTNFAGMPGTAGSNDGALAVARFTSPAGIVRDAAGNLLVADFGNHTIRKITPAGAVTTYAGSPGKAGLVNGALADARFNNPYFLTLDSGTNLYVSDLLNHCIRKVTPEGTVSTFAGGSGQFNRPTGIAFDPAGVLYVVDSANHAIRFVIGDGLVLTLAGTPGVSGSDDGATASARFYFPSDIVVNRAGDAYVADAGGYTIRKISPKGTVTTIAGGHRTQGSNDGTGEAASFTEPTGIRLDTDGSLLVGDSGNHLVRRVTPGGVVTTLGGTGGQTGVADGIGPAARFNRPLSFAPDGSGGFYVTDPFNHRISRATPVVDLPPSKTIPSGPK